MADTAKNSLLAPSSATTSSAGPAETASSPVAEPPRSPPAARRFLQSNVDTSGPLGVWQLCFFFCFLTGFTSAPTFLACYLWAGFQTGGLVQLGLAVGRLFATSDRTFHKPDQQALTSLLSFLLGTSLGRIGDRVGAKKRWWAMSATFISALLTMAAALCAHFSRETSVAEFRTEASWRSPQGMAALGFASASLGLQGIVAKRLNPASGTSLVLTTVWVELANDPLLFARKAVKSRDHRALAVFAAFLGGMCSAGIVFASSSAVAFGVCTGLRVIAVFVWLFMPAEKPKK
ncbi:uncharacterized protein RHOBADRAFT_47715 [Rhodotorula graminis WP1]|uniref:DUF1275 domain protein n=1 Tax=Rhodotorula graminis (strain WP1) TaxID=578459 RepID=A0A0P9IQ14_RHOGW|nr:uncharacterized protein RHOBADRAFT_47715 [Rhodotorula graminis WP1]KPV71537.1 hypothetical protein RHOBADRAFT_47715 [Rhodotorula graminis WP1]